MREQKGIREQLIEMICEKASQLRIDDVLWADYDESINNPGNPSPLFPYGCGIKSVSTQSTEPRPANPGSGHLPALYFGYGGVAEEEVVGAQREQYDDRHSTEEEYEKLRILLYVQFEKFKSSTEDISMPDKNLVVTSARIHDMVGQFVPELSNNLESIGDIGNISDSKLLSVSPMLPGRGPSSDKWLIFEIEISFTYLRGF